MRLKIIHSVLRDNGWLEFDCGPVVLSMPYTGCCAKERNDTIGVLCGAVGIPRPRDTSELHDIEFDLPDSLLPYATTK